GGCDFQLEDAAAAVPKSAGRVLGSPGGAPLPGLSTAGGIKRGPSGVSGTTRACAAATVRELLSDLEDGRLTAPESPDPQSVRDLLAERGVEAVDGRAWEAIDARERGLGEAGGRERTKLANREAMLAEGRSARTRS